jgi:2,3-bisphosphoglycerate-dependent phosphoglycerate mutase
VKVARDITLVYGMNFVALAGCLAVIMRLAISTKMPSDCFTVLLTVALSVSSFYTYLDINIAASFRSVPRSNILLCVCTWLVRLAICIPIAARAVNHQQFLWVLLFIVPPALTAPVTSMLWGGGKYLAVVASVLLYLTLPPVLGVLPYQKNYIYDNKSMTLFYVVLGAGLIFPAGCAQLWRKRSPVESAKHRKEYSFLSVWALVALSFIAIYQVTPARRDASIISNMYYPFEHQVDSLECQRNFCQAMTVYLGMKMTAALVRKVLVYSLNMPAEHCMDLYILHTCPNIFLWLGLANSITSPDVSYTKFWAVFLFFMMPAIEQSLIIKSFMHRLIRQTTQSKHITMEQLDVVWTVLKSVNATCVDPTGEEVLNLQGVGAFLKYVQQLTTGVKEDVPEYMVAALFELLDDDNSGFVSKSELFTYVSSVGLVIDLNGKPRGSDSEKPKPRALAKVTTAAGLMPVSVTKRFSTAASALDLSNAERVIAELCQRDKTASSALIAEMAQAHSKVIKDLSAAAGASPVVIARVSSRMMPLVHQASLTHTSSNGSMGEDSQGRKSEATYQVTVPSPRTSEAELARTSGAAVPPPVAEAPEGGDEAV